MHWNSVKSFFSCDTLCADELLTAEPPSTSTVDDSSHERLVKVARMTEIEDLQAPRSLPYAPLCIKVKSYARGLIVMYQPKKEIIY